VVTASQRAPHAVSSSSQRSSVLSMGYGIYLLVGWLGMEGVCYYTCGAAAGEVLGQRGTAGLPLLETA
jgi:hypothetical protein